MRVAVVVMLMLTASPAWAQETNTFRTSLWDLFAKSFDIFSVVLIAGSIYAVAIIVRTAMDVRASKILPDDSVKAARDLVGKGLVDDLRGWAARDGSFLSPVLLTAIDRLGGPREEMREAAELVASEECARWFRKIEVLNLIGNVAPLVGLAGTVWGMIIAFSSLGATGGQAGPAELSDGIAKALFHTLLGLGLAIPCLGVFGAYRSIVDRTCTRAMVICSELVDGLPTDSDG